MNVVYQLRNDSVNLANMQRASLDKESHIGLRITHGLIGSVEWWSQIESGALKMNSIQGHVSGFWPGQWGDGPAEFQIEQYDGSKYMWLCNVEPSFARSIFSVGSPVKIDFVLQELKTAFQGDHETQVTVAIYVG